MGTRIKKGRVPGPRRYPRPIVEPLEDRLAPAVADLVVTVTDGLYELRPGSSPDLGYRVEVVNLGPDTVANVAVTAMLPGSAPFWGPGGGPSAQTFASGGASISPQFIYGALSATASLPVGGKVTMSAPRLVGSTGNIYANATATLASGDSDLNPANNTATDVTFVGARKIADAFGSVVVATGSDAGAPGQVNVYEARTGQLLATLQPFGDFRGGVRVATGDVTGDGWEDVVVGAGPGAGPHVKVYDGRTLSEISSFWAFDSNFRGGVFVTVAQTATLLETYPFRMWQYLPGQVVVGADAGAGPHVRVFWASGTQVNGPGGSFWAYDPSFHGGVRVAAANIDGAAGDEVITATGPGAAHVKVFDIGGTAKVSFPFFSETVRDRVSISLTEVASFLAYGNFQGGAYVAGGDLDGDGRAEILTGAGTGGPSHVTVYASPVFGVPPAELASFMAFGDFAGGVRVAAEDRDGDHHPDLIVAAGPGAGPHVKVLNGLTLAELDSFWAYDPAFSGGLFVG